MDIRKLEDRKNQERPDRANAAWEKGRASESTPETSPQEEIREAQRRLNEQRQPETQKHSRTIRSGKRRTSRKMGWTDSDQRTERKAPYWVIGLVLLVPIFFLGYLLISNKNQKEQPLIASTKKNPSALDKDFAALSLEPNEKEEFVNSITTAFLHSNDPKERLKYAREPERIAKLLPSFPQQALSELPVDSQMFIDAVSQDTSIQRIEAIFKNGDTRSLYLVRTKQGPKVDWEAYARHSNALQRWALEAEEPSSENKEESAVVRVFIGIENYYNFRFSDDELWMSYRISSPDLEESVTGYAKKGSPTADILDRFLGFEEKRITLQLRSQPADARNKQYQIEKVVALGWVKIEDDFEADWLRKMTE